MQKFDVKKVALSGKNLIEASAGTGKTYSIAVLVMRLLVETELKIKELLLVTFTDAAVAELDERVRLFLRSAYRYLQTNAEMKDALLQEILDEALKTGSREVIAQKLKDSIVLLDELEISTIHGFCNRTQQQFAFETNQLFDKELIKDDRELIDQAVFEYWRSNVTSFPVSILVLLAERSPSFGPSELAEAVKKTLNGYHFYQTQERSFEQLFEAFGAAQEKSQCVKNELIELVPQILADDLSKNHYAKKTYVPKLGTPQVFVEDYHAARISKNPAAYLSIVFPDFFLEKYQEFEETLIQEDQIYQALRIKLVNEVTVFAVERIEKVKKKKSLQTYNDMISGLHAAVTHPSNEGIIHQLKKKYRAVFIDEFQDTDKVQYEIFYEAFGNPKYETSPTDSTIVFYIGDPKQSIYAFRQANLKTYAQARKTSKSFTMSTNFRSVPRYVAAMNVFFKAMNPDFFMNPEIGYIPVEPRPGWAADQPLCLNQKPVEPIAFLPKKEKNEVSQITVVNQILNLLKNGTIEGRAVKPQDFGVLVQKGKQGRELKEILTKVGVPSVVVDDQKVLRSNEARFVRDILEAILVVDTPTLLKALLTPYTLYSDTDLMKLDLPTEKNRFALIIQTANQSGIYPALMQFLNVYNSTIALQLNPNVAADRMLTNYIQLAEICNERMQRYGDDLPSLLDWLMKASQSNDLAEQYEQQLESDSDAVNIVTIHSSKGLAYNISCIYLDSKLGGDTRQFIEYQNDQEKFEYAFSKFDEDLMERAEHQQLEELRRLIYVAITRSVYHSMISYPLLTKDKTEDDSKPIDMIHRILSASAEFSQYFLEVEPSDVLLDAYQQEVEQLEGEVRKVNHQIPFRSSWSVKSYSSIRKKEHHIIKREKIEGLEGYDQFIFKTMPKGAHVGNFLHHIFENIAYNEPQKVLPFMESMLDSALAQNILTKDNLEAYTQMVHQVLGIQLEPMSGASFGLSTVTQKVPEMEFYFSIHEFNEQELTDVFEQPFSFENDQYSGYINGLIDLVFEKNGQYFILDWKSNHLGDHLEAYGAGGVQQAMTESNYHLQYFIYTISLCRYLKQVHPDFEYTRDFGGVFYVFIRGCRKGETSGVFSYKPSWESVKAYL